MVGAAGAGGGAVAGDGELELAQRAELHVVALKQRFAGAGHHILEHAEDGAFGVHAAVLADVLAELFEVHGAVGLQRGVRLLGVVLVQGIGSHGDTVLNGFFHDVMVAPSKSPRGETLLAGSWELIS